MSMANREKILKNLRVSQQTPLTDIYIYMYIYILVGGFNHLEKYESQWEILSHILWKIKNVSNHQPVYIYNLLCPSRTGC
jgi:hypothetical protein